MTFRNPLCWSFVFRNRVWSMTTVKKEDGTVRRTFVRIDLATGMGKFIDLWRISP